jgi:hypothetical protein
VILMPDRSVVTVAGCEKIEIPVLIEIRRSDSPVGDG